MIFRKQPITAGDEIKVSVILTTKYTQWNEISAGEPIRTKQWHDSSFALCNKERVHKIFPEAATVGVL